MANELKIVKKDVIDVVESKIKEFQENGDIHFPPNYSPQNAMKSAWLILQSTVDKNKKPVLEVCTKDSIANSLLDMVVQGLSPAKKQCYFVAYGNQLQLMRSYFGTVAVTKRLKGVKNVVANCIYEGDVFEYSFDLETGVKVITKHEQKFENINPDKIKGAYAIIVTEDGLPNYTEIMNISQIRKAWGQGYAKGASGAHKNFTDQMAKKTVINRACKMFANTSDDSDLLIQAFNNTTENEYKRQDAETEVKQEIKENANKKTLDFNEDEVQDVEFIEVNEEKKEKPHQQEQISLDEGPGF